MRTRIAFPLLIIALLVGSFVSAQVKIGDNPQTIDPASVLELESTDRVLVITRVDSLQMAAIAPNPGALVYNTSADCVFYYNGTEWINLCNGSVDASNFTTDAIANVGGEPTIVITPTETGTNFEVAPNSITTDQITNGSIFAEDLNLGALDGAALVPNSITRDKFRENSIGPFAIQRDSFPLSFFENDAGFITSANIVSGDAGNVITPGADGGAFYDDTNLQNAIVTNTANIAADGDQNPTNEIQDLDFDAATRTLSLSLSGQTVTLPAAAAELDGDPTNELSDLNFDIATNVLSLTNPATPGSSVNLSSLAGGTGASSTVITSTPSITVSGNGSVGSPYALTAVGGGGGGGGILIPSAADIPVAFTATNYAATTPDVEAHLVGIDAALAAAGGGGGGIGDDNQNLLQAILDENNILTIPIENGTATTVDLSALAGGGAGGDDNQNMLQAILDENNILTIPIENGTATTVDLSALAGGGAGGTPGVVDGTTLNGIGTVTDPYTIIPGTDGQLLTTNPAGDVVWATPNGTGNVIDGSETIIDAEASTVGVLGNGTTASPYVLTRGQIAVNPATITGDGDAIALDIAEGGITSDMIAGAAVTTEKIETGDPNQILRTSLDGTAVEWIDLPAGAGGANQNLGQVLALGNDGGAALIKNILNPVDDQDAATKAYVDGAVTSGGATLTNGNILVGSVANAAQPVVLSGDATLDNSGALTIAQDAITSTKILDGEVQTADIADANVTFSKIAPGSSNQILRTSLDGTAVEWGDLPAGTGGTNQNLTLDGNNLGIENGNTIDLTPILGSGGADNQTAVEVPFAPYLTIESTNVQEAISELKDEFDASTPIGEGGNQTAAQVPVTLAATNYEAATQDVEAHLVGINEALAAGNGGNSTLINSTETVEVSGDGSVDTPFELTVTGGGTGAIGGIPNGNILVGDATGIGQPVLLSGDALLNNLGVLSISSGVVNSDKITDGSIALEDLSDMGAADGQVLKFNSGVWAAANDNEGIGGTSGTIVGELNDQTLNIGIEGGTSDDIDLGIFATEAELATAIAAGGGNGTDDQQLTLETGNLLTLENGGTEIDLTPFLDDQTSAEVLYDNAASGLDATDAQAAIDELAADGGSDDQNAGEVLYDNAVSELTATNAQAAIDELAAAGSSDDQNAGEVLYDNAVSQLTATNTQAAIDELAATGGSDDQQLTLSAGNLLTLEEGGIPIDLTSFLDDQNAGEVAYDNAVSELTATNAQAAIDELAAAGGSDDQNAGEVAYDNAVSELTATNAQAAIDELAAAGGGANLENTNLTQTIGEDRTYNLNGGNLNFAGSGGVGIGIFGGTEPVQSTDKLDVNGQIRARRGFAATEGSRGQPSYGFYTNDDTDTGMYRIAEDQIGFSVGGEEALHMVEAGNATNVIINESLELDGPIIDFIGSSGIEGDVLTVNSAGTGVEWSAPGVLQAGSVGETELQNGAVTADKLGADVAGDGIIQNAETGALEIDTSTLNGTGDITGDGITVDGGLGATFADVTLEIADGSILDRHINGIDGGISGSKINPNFGVNPISTSGNITGASIFASNDITAAGQINVTGNVEVGIDLNVAGNVEAGTVSVAGTQVHPDFVFQKYYLGTSNLKEDYNFQSLSEIESFVKKHHHLPGIKSAADVNKEGSWNLGESNLQNLEKIEELYLHTIEQEKKINQLQSEKESLSEEVKALRNDMEEIKAMLKKSE
ncbi:hypothetical protein LCGC14_0822730 [marine sediment metagenome]|uniref:Uncharacterized protein n=2 Tax=root TaxID=1 RepID=A0A831QL27_9FLAO|nr:hypothetical protein [Pricia antarctica]